MRMLLFAFVMSCGSSPAAMSIDAPVVVTTPDAAPIVETHALGMSDVSILLPLPVNRANPVLLAVTDGPLILENVLTPLSMGEIGPKTGALVAYGDYQVVAVRFDPCDGFSIGGCVPITDGRLRLVLQPLFTQNGATSTQDIAVHAFYPILNSELPGFVQELRALARIQNLAPDAPLQVSPAALAGNTEYLDRLRTLVQNYARADHLLRLTVIGQEAESAAFAWIMRGFDRPTVNARFSSLNIPQVDKPAQKTQLTGGDVVYNIEPVFNSPSGMALAMNGLAFGSAPAIDRRGAVAALAETENPQLHDAVDLQCANCHVANYLKKKRALEAGVDVATLPQSYQTTRNVAVNSIADTDERTIRAFGYESTFPAISQRVANDSAQVLDLIEQRFR